MNVLILLLRLEKLEESLVYIYIYIYIVTNSLSGGYENKNDEMNELI
jgi:hypothetical protein